MTYIPNGGQTYLPVKDNIQIDFLPFEKPEKPNPELEPFELTEAAKSKGYILPSQKQHFLPGVTEEMLDWFFANMEKCYYLWAPGSHKKFTWVRAPFEVGFEDSIHMISESTGKGLPVFGGEGVEIHRLHLHEFFPLKTALSHVICEGVLNEEGELFDSTIHMWENTEGGVNHVTLTVANTKCPVPPKFILDLMKEHPATKPVPNWATDHEDYEASQWPIFLPTLYHLWEHHPDPSQNVKCNLEVQKGSDGTYHYTHNNGPVLL